MSATRDKTQQFAFVYSNLYQLYKKGKEAAMAADSAPKGSGAVLKAGDLKAGDLKDAAFAQLRVKSYTPVEILQQRAKTAALPIVPQKAPEPPKAPEPKLGLPKIGPSPVHMAKATSEANHAIKSLKDNLKTLNDLHARLRFMLTELEDLVRE